MERLLELGGARVEFLSSEVAGRRIHHIECGVGPAVILLHGASGGGANWYRLLATVAQQYRVLAPDLPGFGLSQSLEPGAPLGERLAEWLEQWLDGLGISSCTLVGTSFGGLVVLRLAQRAARRVRAAVLIDSVGLGRELPLLLRIAVLGPLARVAVRPSRAGTRWQFGRYFVADPARMPAEQVDALIEYLWRSAIASDRQHLARAYNRFANLHGQREILSDEELRRLQIPVLILWGERDRFLPISHGRRAAALVPGSRFRIIPDAGHSPNWEAPETVLANLMSFLRDVMQTRQPTPQVD